MFSLINTEKYNKGHDDYKYKAYLILTDNKL